MEKQLEVISAQHALSSSEAREKQSKRELRHRAKRYRLPGEAAGSFFGPGLA